MSQTPAYGSKTCDHGPIKASLDAFSVTTRNVLQPDGDGGWLLLGNCPRCNSTLAVEIGLARGHVVKGQIAADARARAVPGQDVIAAAHDEWERCHEPPPVRSRYGFEEPTTETADEHAARVIK